MRIIVGLVLLALPVWFAFSTMVPFPQYRVGTIADFIPAIRTCVALYGGATVGLVGLLLTRPRRASSSAVFRACFAGSMLAVFLAIILAGPGNLWGLVVIFGAAFSAIIAFGIRLLWQAGAAAG